MADTPYPYSLSLSPEERQSLDRRLRDLAEVALRGEMGLLLGAGFSYSVKGLPLGIPLAAKLVERSQGCNQEVAARIAAKFGLGAAAQAYGEDAPQRRNALEDFLKKELGTGASPSPALKGLESIVTNARVSRVFTTNYDHLIEDALPSRAISVEPTATALAAFEQAEEEDRAIGVFHIYGDLKHPKITEEDLQDADSIHLVEFRHELLRKLFAFIGYSFRDDHLISIYRDITALLNRTQDSRRPFLVTPVEDGHEYAFAKRLWNRRHGMVLIPMAADVFLEHFLSVLADEAYLQAADAYAPEGIDPQDFVAQLKDASAKLGGADPRDVVALARKLRGMD